MIIRDYDDKDERSWVICRLISFLDCSYYDNVMKEKEKYENPSVCLLAEEDGQVIGIIDVEYEQNPGEVCYLSGKLGAVIWHLGVLPEFRGKGVADTLWNTAKKKLFEKGIERFEVWTQDDITANDWYNSQGFMLKEAYLNAYIRGVPSDEHIRKYINTDCAGSFTGVRCFNFEVPIERKEEMEKICYRLHEVRLYEMCI